jgi:hypothetical protein
MEYGETIGNMSKASYDKLLRKLQEAKAEILDLRSKVIECSQKVLELQKAGKNKSATSGGSAAVSPLDTAKPRHEWQQPLNRIDSIHLLMGLVGTFLAVVVPTVWQKVPGLILMCFGFAYFIWFSQITHGLNKSLRLVVIVVILGGINYAVVPQLVDQWRTDHMRSELAFNANAPGIGYPDGDHYGIKWSKNLAEIRLTVTSKARFPIQNLNLSVWMMDKGDAIVGMAQTDPEPQGCVVRRPRGKDLPPLVLRGQDGSRADISDFMNDQMNALIPFRDHYDLLCQRILADEAVPLVIGALTQEKNGDMSVAPPDIHIKGDYETTAAEGSKRVPVDETVSIATLPRWK